MSHRVLNVGSLFNRGAVAAARLAGVIFLCSISGCITSMMPGSLKDIQPTSDMPRAGNVYVIRGWGGMFSWGMDEMTREINQNGVRAHIYRHEQRDELGQTLVEKYKGVSDPEPLCIIAHSAGSDDALNITRQLKEAGIAVDLLITLDNVDVTVVSNNVRLCYNYWTGDHGSNFLHGLPYTLEAGGTGKLNNINLVEEGKDLCEPGVSHTKLDKDLKLRKVLIQNVLDSCPERAAWLAQHPGAAPASRTATSAGNSNPPAAGNATN